MISCAFTKSFYAVGIFVDATNNYRLTKSSKLQANFRFMSKACQVLRYIQHFFTTNAN